MKRKFIELINSRGFDNIHQFAKACGIESCNVYTNLKGSTKLGMDRAYLYANTLGVPIQQVLEVLRPQDEKENKRCIKERDKFLLK